MAKKETVQPTKPETSNLPVRISPTMMALLQPSAAIQKKLNEAKLERRNAPPLFKMATFPIGQCLIAQIEKHVGSFNTAVKGRLLWLKTQNGMECLFPVTGTIRTALCGNVEGEKAVSEALDKEVGKWIFLTRLPDGISTKHDKAGKVMYMFDVRTCKTLPDEFKQAEQAEPQNS